MQIMAGLYCAVRWQRVAATAPLTTCTVTSKFGLSCNTCKRSIQGRNLGLAKLPLLCQVELPIKKLLCCDFCRCGCGRLHSHEEFWRCPTSSHPGGLPGARQEQTPAASQPDGGSAASLVSPTEPVEGVMASVRWYLEYLKGQ